MRHPNSLLITGGAVIDPATKRDGRCDVLIEDGLIAEIQPSLRAREGLPVIDATGKLVLPGFVDLHVHFRQPGREDKETIETGSRAAARGGFAAVRSRHRGRWTWLLNSWRWRIVRLRKSRSYALNTLLECVGS